LLDVMELRIAMETEAAALAAERRSTAARRRVEAALAGVDAALARGEPAIDEDLGLHRAIAEATGNALFVDFLRYLGPFSIPRQSVRLAHRDAAEQAAYLARVQDEHRRIVEAIVRRNREGAREAMRAHLANSRERYRRLREERRPRQPRRAAAD
jgi:DNA-binding FadR family transcriptional regulator